MVALSEKVISEKLASLNGWVFENDKISKQFVFRDFKEAFGFLTRIAFEAEEQEHHPEIVNVYNQVTISLQTHDAGNKVTEYDIKLAEKIEFMLNN